MFIQVTVPARNGRILTMSLTHMECSRLLDQNEEAEDKLLAIVRRQLSDVVKVSNETKNRDRPSKRKTNGSRFMEG